MTETSSVAAAVVVPMPPPPAEYATVPAERRSSSPSRTRRIIGAVAAVAVLMTGGGPESDTLGSRNPYQAAIEANPDCPPELHCVVDLAALSDDGECNYSSADRPTDQAILGIVEHITEANLSDTLAGYDNPNRCISANYVVAPDGMVYETVPPKDVAFAAANRYFNNHYIQIENVGFEDCSSIKPKQLEASEQLARYLIARFNIAPNSSTIIGHDSVPGINDAGQSNMHIDPGVCWKWGEFLTAVGAPTPGTAEADGSVVMITPVQAQNKQAVTNCTDGLKQCKPMEVSPGVNFLSLYMGPSTEAPLLSDPYLHPDGSPGTTTQQDWGDKAPYGHEYVVAERLPGWTAIWFGGEKAWFPDNGQVLTPVQAAVVRPKGDAPVVIYGRPYPESTPNTSALTEYHMLPGQAYTVAEVAGTDGSSGYIQIFYNHRLAYVRAQDVSPVS